MNVTYPLGPRASTWEVLRIIASGQKFDALEFVLMAAEQFGRFSYTVFGPVRLYTVSDAELMHNILVKRADRFHKVRTIKEAFKPFVGNGLLLSEGDFWRRQRRLAQPAFHARRIESYAGTMTNFAGQMLDGWRDGEQRWIDREMMKLTLAIVCKTLFDADVTAEADRVGELMTEMLEASNDRVNAAINLPDWMPTPRRLRVRRAVAELDTLIQRFIDERRASGEDRGDLLSMLLTAQDDDGIGMTDKQLRDEVMTLFIAGHETTAMALSWTWYLLAQNPDALAKLQHEVDSVLNGRTPTLQDLADLPYTDMVVKEAMRLYPPAPGVGRQPVEDIEIGGYTVPKDTMMILSMYAMHRDPVYFPDPLRFDPERFSAENEPNIPHYAYLPFGGGPRVCIGNMFAMMEARLILAMMAQRCELILAPGQTVKPQQMVTIRPQDGLRMWVALRQPAPVVEAV